MLPKAPAPAKHTSIVPDTVWSELHKNLRISSQTMERLSSVIEACVASGDGQALNATASSAPFQTAVEIAIYARQPEILDLLLRSGANPHVRSADPTPLLCLAAASGAPEITRLLLAAGLSPNIGVDPKGNTPLLYASSSSNRSSPEVVSLLLQAGATVDTVCRCLSASDPPFVICVTALSNAVVYGNESVVRLLLDAGADPRLPPSGSSDPFYGMNEPARIMDLPSTPPIESMLRAAAALLDAKDQHDTLTAGTRKPTHRKVGSRRL